MILKFCDDNFLFYITHAKYFNILCYFVIFFLICLIFLTFNNKFIDKLQKNKFKMFFIVLFSGIFVGFLIFLFAWLLNKDTFNGCSTKYYQNIYFKMLNIVNKKSDSIKNSKIVIVGDSRMEFIANDETITKPFNVEFVAKSSTHIDWFKNTASKKIQLILNKNSGQYSVVINMGVNDLNWLKNNYDEKNLANDYYNAYMKLIKSNPNVKFYLLSVNPLDEELIKKRIPDNKRSNKSIEKYNNYLKNKIKNSKLENLLYCDSYNYLKFTTKDGLHYTQDTNKKIINYIINKCVQY